MIRLYKHEAEFEANIRILTKDEGGRSTPFHNGIRWDFVYGDKASSDGVHMIWPEFIDDNGDAIDKGLFLEGNLKARMHIVVEDMLPFHRDHLTVGMKFVCVEGVTKVAIGEVTKITGLNNET